MERIRIHAGSGETNARAARIGFVALLAAFLAYGLMFIWRMTFVFGGVRRFALFDDAMISMRFARNLAEGHGLVWNPGAPAVEGFTNLLWVLYMALLHIFPFGESRTALAVQLTSLAALAINLVFVQRLATRLSNDGGKAFPGASAIAVWFALILTAFYLPLNNWALQGMEVGVLALITTVALAFAVRGLEEGRVPFVAYLLLGIATLVRLDMVVPLVVVTAYLAIADGPERRRRHAAFGLGAVVLFVGAQTLFRVAYYGQVLPNTYYLKLSGFPIGARIGRGARVFLDFAWRLNPVLFLLPLAGAWFRLRRKMGRAPGLLLCVLGAQCLYSIWVGGDAWERWGGANRFICVVMPVFFILLGLAVSDAYTFARRRKWSWAPAASIALLVISIVQVNLLRGEPTPRGLLLIDPPLEAWGDSWATVDAYAIRAVTTEDASVAVVWAGSIPYFSRRPSIDLLGRCDARIARGPAHPGDFYPGHMKWDYAWSIGELKPDVIAQFWSLDDPASYTTLAAVPEDARPFVEGNYALADIGGYRMLLRKGSPRILWDKVRPYLKELGK